MDYAAEVEQAVTFMRHHWENRTAPPDASLGAARRLLNTAERLVQPASEQTENLLDVLHGYMVWGRIMSSVALLDPALLAEDRRRRRCLDAVLARELEERRVTRADLVPPPGGVSTDPSAAPRARHARGVGHARSKGRT